MEEKKNKMKTYQLVLPFFIVIVIIFALIYAFNKQNNIFKDLLAKKNAEMQEKLEENKGKELDFNSDIVQTIFPLTGAFPGNDMRYIASIKNMNLQNITNDFILKLGWAKVTNEDLASSYQGEGLPSTIDAKILDNYIKDIFGDIAYVKDDFSNIDLRLEASDNSLYDITYNQEEDKYYINFIEDDKVEDSFILNIDPKVIQYDNKIEIIVHPIYIKNLGTIQKEDGSFELSCVAYQHYNFETKSFTGRLTDTITTNYRDNYSREKELKLNSAILAVKEDDLETYTFTYVLDKETSKYKFYSLSYN